MRGLRDSFSRSTLLLIISSLELGDNLDRMFSRYLLEEFLREMVHYPGTIYVMLMAEAVMMARRDSAYLRYLLRFSERGEVLVHKGSWDHYFAEEEPFVGRLCDMSELVSKMIVADKVVHLG